MASKSQQKVKTATVEEDSQPSKELKDLKEQVSQLRREITNKNQALLQTTVKHERDLCGHLAGLKLMLRGSSEGMSEKSKLNELAILIMKWGLDLRKLVGQQGQGKLPSNHEEKSLSSIPEFVDEFHSQSISLNEEALQNLTIEQERLTSENNLKEREVDYLQSELRRHQHRSEQLFIEGEKWKEEASAVSAQLAQNQVELRRVLQQNGAIKLENKELMIRVQSCKEQIAMLSNKLQSLKRENKRLTEQHRQSFKSQQALNSIIAENEREIQKICTEAYRLKLQIHHFQLKFKEILENDQKERALQLLKPKKSQPRFILCQIPTQNTIDTLQSKTSKLDAARLIKFNLQFYQQKLMNLSSAASIYLP